MAEEAVCRVLEEEREDLLTLLCMRAADRVSGHAEHTEERQPREGLKLFVGPNEVVGAVQFL